MIAVIAARIRVIGQPGRHQQRSTVGGAKPQRPVVVRVARNRFRGIPGVVDQNFLRRDQYLDCTLVRLHIETARGGKLHKIQRREIAGRVIQKHIFRARIRRIDPRSILRRVPPVDGGVVLHTRVATLPCSLGDLVQQLARLKGLHRSMVAHAARRELLILYHRLHELIVDAD
jgi:hypothetical protein